MAQVEKYFGGISEAIEAIADCIGGGGLAQQDAEQIMAIVQKMRPNLPAFEYALKLYSQEPKMVTDKCALAIACGEICEGVMEMQAISSFGTWDDRWATCYDYMKMTMAFQYLLWVLPHAHQKLCRYAYRK